MKLGTKINKKQKLFPLILSKDLIYSETRVVSYFIAFARKQNGATEKYSVGRRIVENKAVLESELHF